ncbi:MBOAT family protein, partial [Helicobacter didelphidarum]
WILTFNFVNIAWIFFRAENLDTAISLLKSMFGISWVGLPQKWYKVGVMLGQLHGSERTLLYIIISFFICFYCKNSIYFTRYFKPDTKTFLITMLLLWMPIVAANVNPYNEFIYFNF